MIKNISNSKGFTLVELLIAMVLGSIISTAVYSVFLDQQKQYITQELVTGMQQNARAAMDRMTQEIRMANCCVTLANYFSGLSANIQTGTTGAYNQGINILGPSYIEFAADLDTNTANAEIIRYYYCPTTANVHGWTCNLSNKIYRYNGSSTEIAAENITDLSFTYGMDSNDDDIIDLWTTNFTGSDPSRTLRTVRISLRSQTQEALPPPIGIVREYTIVSEVTPRNTLGNL